MLEEVVLPPFRGLSYVSGTQGTDAAASKVHELYFPKPYNDEQVQIIQLLEVHDGVVVQGPPGTGKTHTIANVISHYLANGKRVLVTSMKDPALAVLLRRPLCGERRAAYAYVEAAQHAAFEAYINQHLSHAVDLRRSRELI